MTLRFPLDVIAELGRFTGRLGKRIRAVKDMSMVPPYPWGHWTYGRLVQRLRSHEGDFAELGVGYGGLSFLLGMYAQDQGRRMWCFDSFAGLPPPRTGFDNPYFHEGEYGPRLDRDVELVAQFERLRDRLGLTETIRTVKGFFSDTLPTVPRRARFAFVHLDSDLYDSVMQSLEFAWPRLVDGGIVAIDDFFHHAQGPARATRAFFDRHRIDAVLEVVFPYSVFVRKGTRRRQRPKRSLDGHRYSFDELRRDPVFREVVATSARRRTVDARRARALLDLIDRAPSSADVYDYWSSLVEFWDMFEREPRERSRILL